MINLGFKAVFKVKDWATEFEKDRAKAQTFALTHSSIKLMKVAREDLKTGRLKLKRLSHLSHQPGVKKRRYRKNVRARMLKERAPFTGLFRGITYNVNRLRGISQVGFLGVGGTKWQTDIVEKSVAGYQWVYSDKDRKKLHKLGIHLRPSTTYARVPPRDAVGAIWNKRKSMFYDNFNAVYLRKLTGERVEKA